MGLSIFMEYNNELIQFPVNPEELGVSKEGNNETTEVVKLGEINIPKDTKLATIEFESFFPKHNVGSYVRTRNKFQGPQFYMDFINKVRNDKKPVRFIVSDTNINMLALIDNFKYSYKAGDDDTYFTIALREYREYRVKTVKISDYKSNRPQVKKEEPKRPASTNKSVTPGSSVIVNGRLHRDSYGSGPGMTLSNYQGKINFVQNGRSHPYHVTNPSGGWMGWVTASSVRVL
ncbi:hydrolase [Clostridium paraputrificum]|uniref:hydrolase n=1 Tax=Clostridium paraputrificum TaxID=29363 RepID=UPI003D3416B6